MDRQAANSTTIASFGYDPIIEVLEVEFHKSGVYQYFNVPASVFEQFLAAPSHGVFLNTYIKGQYPFEKA
ncbi:hypothetical protein ABID26_001188 [Mesorhizobium shonense]|uniref:KTSC domain-containing protein n=1 Tax=Mesorhizobium shonense TaxID=1209948 RepID=A0ABV2HN07_9HYPH